VGDTRPRRLSSSARPCESLRERKDPPPASSERERSWRTAVHSRDGGRGPISGSGVGACRFCCPSARAKVAKALHRQPGKNSINSSRSLAVTLARRFLPVAEA